MNNLMTLGIGGVVLMGALLGCNTILGNEPGVLRTSESDGAGGGDPCMPGETRTCYSGPEFTEGIGQCKAGVATCNSKGSGFGACDGEVGPAPEDCATSDVDEDCDGKAAGDADDGCGCAPGTVYECSTALLGVCAMGQQTCDVSGMQVSECSPKVAPGFDDCNTAADEDCDGDVVKCTGTPIFGKAYGMSMLDTVAWGVDADSQGNVIVGGSMNGQLMVIKVDPTGAKVWEKIIAPTGTDPGVVLHGLAVDESDNIIAVGNLKGSLKLDGISLLVAGDSFEVLVVAIDKEGATKWGKTFGDGPGGTLDQTGNDIAIDSAGNIFITGAIDGTALFGAASLVADAVDAYVAKLTPLGTVEWAVRAGDGATQWGYAVAVDTNNDVFVTGANFGTIDFGGGPIMSGGLDDGYLVKLSGVNGLQLWAKGLGDVAGKQLKQEGIGVGVGPDGAVVVFGRYQGSIDIDGVVLDNFDAVNVTYDLFAAKYAAEGALVWAKRFGAVGSQAAGDVTVDGAGNIILVGYFASTFGFGGPNLMAVGVSDTTRDAYVAKLTPDGDHLWSARFGDQFEDFASGVATDKDGNVFVCGFFENILHVDGVGAVTASGGYDAFVLGLSP